MTEDLAWIDACGQAALVRSGDVEPIELVDAAIARIEKLNPELNAVITPLFDEARRAATSPELPDGPFRGVPFLLKDLGACQAGMPQFRGNKALRDAGYVCPADTPLGRRFRDAGLIALGKTNTPELGCQSTTQPLAFGPTRNPWDVTRSTAGSSGGSAAAVVSGMVSIAHANDGGGSIRLPAAWCGLVGLKPSRGRVSLGPEMALAQNVAELAVTRTVRDAAAILDAVRGNEPGDLFLCPAPERRYVEELGRDPGRLRIGIHTELGSGSVDNECIAGAEAAGRLLESLGHIVERACPAAFMEPAMEIDLAMRTAVFGIRQQVAEIGTLLGRDVTEDDVEPFLWQISQRPLDATAADLVKARVAQQAWTERMARWWADGFDLLLTPTAFEPPATLEELTPPVGAEGTLAFRIQHHCGFTMPFNATGQPAISLPLHRTPDGLPVGIQLVAAMGREDVLIRVASQLEQAASWVHLRPAVSA
jgi:amidase